MVHWVSLLTDFALCPPLQYETLIDFSPSSKKKKKLNSPFFCAFLPLWPLSLPHGPLRTVLFLESWPSIMNLGLCFAASLKDYIIEWELCRKIYLVMTLQKMYWNIVAYKWIDICWTLFFQSLNGRYASILIDVFRWLISLVLNL